MSSATPSDSSLDAMDTSFETLLRLAWPVVVARSSQAVIGFSDALMSAPLGETALAAVTTGSINTFTVIILPMGLVFIAQSFAAQLAGQNRMTAAVRYAWYALILSALSMLLTIASIPMIGSFLGLFGYEPGVQQAMTDYLNIRMFGVGAAVGIEALGNWYGGIGNTRLHMNAGIVCMISNVFLNWVFIFGNLGAPAMGVEGAALASAISSWIGFAVILAAFLRRVSLDVSPLPKDLRFDELLRMCRFGLPHGLNWFLEFAAFAIFINAVVGQLGTTVLAAMMVVFNINSVSFMPAFGVASSGAILTGQAIGRRQPDAVWQIVKRTLTVTLAWQGSVALLYILMPRRLMGLFAESQGGEDLLEIGVVMLAMSAAWQLFDATMLTFSEALRSAGDTSWTMWARIFGAWFVFIPSAYLSVHVYGGGYVAAMFCIIGYMLFLSSLMVYRFRTDVWRSIDLTGLDPVLVE